MSEGRPRVAALAPIPADLCEGVSARVDLVPHDRIADLTQEQRAGIDRALTMAMVGAPAALLDLLPNLATIASCGAGLDRYDPAALAARGIALHPTPDVMTEDTAEMAVALAFAVLRRVVQNDAHVRSGRWASARAPLGRRLAGRRAGIVGLGRIGTAVAHRLEPLGLAVAYTGRGAKPGIKWPFVADIAALAEASDVLVLSLAGGEATRHIVDARVLDALGPEGVLINVSRGSVVDEAALLAALETGAIAGAGLDVFAQEPTPDPRFAALDSVVLQPHAATYTFENRRDLVEELVRLLTH